MNEKRIIRSGLILLVALTLSGLIAFAQISNYKASEQTVVGTNIGGSFALVDQHGKPFTEQNMLGHYSLAYFGFTFCPAICPTELQKINIVMKNIGPLSAQVQPVFFTVDPARDTPKVMAAYVAQFNPRLVGLTGTQAQVDTALKAYRVYARKVEDPKMSEYTMDHSSYIYLIDKDGKIASLFGPDQTAKQIAESLKAIISR